MSSSKLELFYELSNNCPMYEPCPICYKCQVKASHLYEQCAACPLEFDAHTYKQRALLIRRENFAIKVSKKTFDQLKVLQERSKESSNEKK